jgi:endonuclease-3
MEKADSARRPLSSTPLSHALRVQSVSSASRAREILGRLNAASSQWPATSPERYRGNPYAVLLVCVLSTRTREEATIAAARRLLHIAPSPEALATCSAAELEPAIAGVAFPRMKAIRLVRLGHQLVRLGGEVPRDYDGLCSLPGVGPKVAHITLDVGYGIRSGIAVDTHLARVSSRLGLVEGHHIGLLAGQLEAQLPRESWGDWNRRMVQLGRNICLPRLPRCAMCLLADLCPTAKRAGC